MAARSDPAGKATAFAPNREPLRLEDFLPYRLNYVAAEVSQALSSIYGSRFGITIPEWRVVATLGQFGSTTARDIGQHSRMHKTTVSRAVATLEKRKIITRRVNSDDLREAFLALTETGTQIYREVVPLAQAFSDSLCEGLTRGEREQLDILLTRLSERLAKIGPPFSEA